MAKLTGGMLPTPHEASDVPTDGIHPAREWTQQIVTLLTESVTRLIEEFAKLPGHRQEVGRAAGVSRAASTSQSEALALADAIRDVKENVRHCQDLLQPGRRRSCAICRDPQPRSGPAVRRRATARSDGPGAGGQFPRACITCCWGGLHRWKASGPIN